MIFKQQFVWIPMGLALSAALLVTSVVFAQQPDANEQERKAWDQIFEKEKGSFSKEPNAFLVRSLSTRAPGRALDVGMGQGRNTFWLAEHGWTVTGFDISPIAVEQARREAARRRLNAEMLVTPYQNFDWGKEKWDLILFCYFFPQSTLPQVWESLRPGRRADSRGRLSYGLRADEAHWGRLYRQTNVPCAGEISDPRV